KAQAQWATTSQPSTAAVTASRSRTSADTYSTPGWGVAGNRRASPTTRWPRRRRRSEISLPKTPLAPVTRTLSRCCLFSGAVIVLLAVPRCRPDRHTYNRYRIVTHPEGKEELPGRRGSLRADDPQA